MLIPAHVRSRRWHSLALPALLALAPGCDDDPVSPFEPEIGNVPDSFQFQVTGVEDLSATVAYEWQNTGTRANVNQATSLSSGAAELRITDAAGTEVYRRSLTDNGTFQTGQGVAGSWNIRVEFADATGTVNFRVQRP